MKRVLSLAVAAALLAAPVALAETDAIKIYGGPDHKTFLGCITCGELDPTSVWNQMGDYYWGNPKTWAPTGPNVTASSVTSICNESAAADPPVMRGDDGRDYGRLTADQDRSDSVCGPQGASRVCRVMLILCNS